MSGFWMCREEGKLVQNISGGKHGGTGKKTGMKNSKEFIWLEQSMLERGIMRDKVRKQGWVHVEYLSSNN